MKVQPSALLLDQILNTDSRYLNISYKNRNDLDTILNKIEPLVLTHEPHYNDLTGIALIRPKMANIEYIFDTLPPTMRAKIKGYNPKKIQIPYFEGDTDLYKILSRKSSECKIIEDEFSVLRGSILFEYISRIEKGIREEIVQYYSLDETKKSTHHDRGAPDYFLNFFPLKDLINEYLLSPVSNQHFVELAREAGSDQTKLIEARTKTKLEELSLPFTVSDISMFTKIRNKTMHFRVVTTEDSRELLRLAHSFDNFKFKKILEGVGSVVD